MNPSVVVVGVGNAYRRDDGVGPAVVEELRARHVAGVTFALSDGDPMRLMDLWDRADLAIVIDAVSTSPPHPGRIHWQTLAEASHRTASSHGLGVADAVELARVLGRLPPQLVIFGVEPDDVSVGMGLSAPVQAAVADVADAVCAEISPL